MQDDNLYFASGAFCNLATGQSDSAHIAFVVPASPDYVQAGEPSTADRTVFDFYEDSSVSSMSVRPVDPGSPNANFTVDFSRARGLTVGHGNAQHNTWN